MNFKKFGLKLLFPNIAIMFCLTPLSIAFLVYSMVCLGETAPLSIVSYVLSAYTLTVWCLKIPNLIKHFKTFKNENKFARLWLDDRHLRVNVSLYSALIWNTAYAVFMFVLGIYHATFWYYSIAMYYFLLAVTRFFLVRHTRRHDPKEKMLNEFLRYRFCAVILLFMNISLSIMIFFMVYWNRTFSHHEITTISMATFTFTSLTFAIINTVKYRKIGSPVYSASKAINLASASVSMITLEATMLTTFNDGTLSLTGRRVFLGLSGCAVSLFIITMAISMIVVSNKKIKLLNSEKEKINEQ